MSEVISKEVAGVIQLSPVQLLRTIDETRELLVKNLVSGANVVIDCSQVEDVDVSIVQVLLAARVTADRLGIALRLRAPSPALRGVLERAGVTGATDDPFWNGAAA